MVWSALVVVLTLLLHTGMALASLPASLTLTASPSIILADGKSTTTITALATSEGGANAPNGAVVRFSSSAGVLSAYSVSTSGGIARVTLTSTGIAAEAIVTANFVAGSSAASAKVSVEFTNDRSLANTNESEESWAGLSSTDYMAYSEDSRVAEAFAKKQGVHFEFRGLSIDADAMQVDFTTNILRARNAIVNHDRHPILTADSLHYEFLNQTGTAIVTNVSGDAHIETLRIEGSPPTTSVIPVDEAPSGSTYDFVDLSEDHLMVTASSLSVKPSQIIHLRRATVYIDGKKVVSLALEVLPVNSKEIFGQKILGYGTDGVYVNMPYYLSATTHTLDSISLRSQSAERETGVAPNNNGTFSLDYDHSYTFAKETGSGSLELLGIQEGANTGYRWHNTMMLGKGTHTYLDLDYPDRQNLFTTASISHDFQGFTANLSNSTSNATGDSTSTKSQNTTEYVSTLEHKLFGSDATGLRMTTNVTATNSSVTEQYYSQTLATHTQTEAVGVRLFTPAVSLGSRTSLTDSYDINETYDNILERAATTMDAGIGLNRKLGTTTSGSLTYDWTHNPLNQSLEVTGGSLVLSQIPNLNRFGVSLTSSAIDSKWDTLLCATIATPTNDYNASAGVDFNFNPSWSVGLNSLYNRTAGLGFRDYSGNVGIRIGQRMAQLSYSLVDHHIRFNLDASRF